MTRVLLIIPNLGAGGAQKVFRDQLNFYSKHFETIGCVFDRDRFLPEDDNLNLVSLDVPAGGSILSKAWRFIQRIRRLKAVKKKYKIDISISHLEGADYVNLLSQTNDKTICWIHGTKEFDGDIRGFVGTIRKKILMPVLYKKSDRIITVSEGIRKELIAITGKPSRITTMLNGIDIDMVERRSKDAVSFPIPTLKREAPVIFTHCRLAPQKNIPGLIEVFSKAIEKRKAKLVIAGDGKLKEQLVAMAEGKGLKIFSAERDAIATPGFDIYFAGHHSNPYSLLATSDVYVMTSSWEGFPLALCEAMACGVPSIAADCFTGPREILAPGLSGKQPIAVPCETDFGILMPLADNQANINIWADALCALLDDKERQTRYSEAGKRRIAELDQGKIRDQWFALING